MPGKTITVEHLLSEAGAEPRSQLAQSICYKHQEWNNYRTNWMNEKSELRNYLFATDTRTTSNSKLPWKNSTTVPKLTQIRDNLHANYMAALFPNKQWVKWEGLSEDAEIKKKRTAIESYVTTKLELANAETTFSQLVLDWIDYGNCFATIEWADESFTNPDTEEVIPGYLGPKIVRISPYDIVFNPTAPTFNESPKIIRKLVDIGEIIKKIETMPADSEYRKRVEMALKHSMNLRQNATGLSTTDVLKADGYEADGFTSYQQYLGSGLVEVLTFYGNIYDSVTQTYKTNHVIEVFDRLYITRDEPNSAWSTAPQFYHAGWRLRPDNLYAMGPLDNLVGMQYRIDHLENLKADVFDLIAYPVQKIRGFVEDYEYEPGARIYVGEDGEVEFMRPDATALNADIQIENLELRMEQLAGAPREAMGIRSPGEKTKFEVQTLDNAASRMFLSKARHFERTFVEAILNGMLALARQNMMATDTVRTLTNEIDAVVFSTITKEDITAGGNLRARGASHFEQRANALQNLLNILNSSVAQDPDVKVHISGKRTAQLIEDLSDLDRFSLFGDNIRIEEQAETAQLANAAQEQTDVQALTPPGITEPDTEI